MCLQEAIAVLERFALSPDCQGQRVELSEKVGSTSCTAGGFLEVPLVHFHLHTNPRSVRVSILTVSVYKPVSDE